MSCNVIWMVMRDACVQIHLAMDSLAVHCMKTYFYGIKIPLFSAPAYS